MRSAPCNDTPRKEDDDAVHQFVPLDGAILGDIRVLRPVLHSMIP